jgi:hypothetical protein
MIVEVDGVKSTPHSISSGVPQRCIPSPLFFLFLSIICVLVFVVQSFISMMMISRFICLGDRTVMTTYPQARVNSLVCLSLIFMIFVFFRSFSS